jgi:hypothetical protein
MLKYISLTSLWSFTAIDLEQQPNATPLDESQVSSPSHHKCPAIHRSLEIRSHPQICLPRWCTVNCQLLSTPWLSLKGHHHSVSNALWVDGFANGSLVRYHARRQLYHTRVVLCRLPIVPVVIRVWVYISDISNVMSGPLAIHWAATDNIWPVPPHSVHLACVTTNRIRL